MNFWGWVGWILFVIALLNGIVWHTDYSLQKIKYDNIVNRKFDKAIDSITKHQVDSIVKHKIDSLKKSQERWM